MRLESGPEHADLLDDMIPIARCLELIGEKIMQLVPHVDNPLSHGLDVPFPLLE